MNQKDRTEFDLIHNKIDHITQSIEDMKTEMDKAHQEVSTDIKFVKENLFNPHEGLWAETKQRTPKSPSKIHRNGAWSYRCWVRRVILQTDSSICLNHLK